MILDRNNVRRDWGPSALNATHQASISAHYELPFGKGKRWMTGSGAIGYVVGGWQLNTITTLLSGFPFTPTVGSNRSGDGDTRNPDRPSLNPAFTGPVVTGNPNQWFNPAAFLLPAAGTWGSLGRRSIRRTGPGNGGSFLDEIYRHSRESQLAIPSRSFQSAQSRELWHSQRRSVLIHRRESVGRIN